MRERERQRVRGGMGEEGGWGGRRCSNIPAFRVGGGVPEMLSLILEEDGCGLGLLEK